MTKIKFGILGGVLASLITISPSFGAVMMLQGTSLDLQGTVNEDAIITFKNGAAEIRQDGVFSVTADDKIKLEAGTGKGVEVSHNILKFATDDKSLAKYGDPTIDFTRSGSKLTSEDNSVNLETDKTIKLVGDTVRVDHNYLAFVNDAKYPTPTIDFVREGAKLTANDGLKVEGSKGLTVDGPLTVNGTQTMTGNQHVTGTLQVDGASTLAAVSSAGTIDFTGATINIGNASSVVTVNSTTWKATAGALTGITGITMGASNGNFLQNGSGTFGTGIGAVSLNGNTTMANSTTFAAKGITNSGVYTQSGTSVNTFTGATTFSPTLASASTVVNGTTGTPATALKIEQPGAATAVWIDGTATSASYDQLMLVENNSPTLTTSAGVTIENGLGGNMTRGLEFVGAMGSDIKLQNAETIDNAVNGTVLVTAPITRASAALQAAGLLTGELGLTVTGATTNLNASSNFGTNINTGSSTGTVTIGGTAGNTIDIGTDDTTAQTIAIGSLKDTTSFTGANWSIATTGVATLASASKIGGTTITTKAGTFTTDICARAGDLGIDYTNGDIYVCTAAGGTGIWKLVTKAP
ncbi:MAG: hypothetical protein NT141_01215 [candidate division WWE3 bacterium]|nr:hypothetical protein [candidate division WWE3 bacterium]